jgi:N-sulfoglucosamine sulfohydrolase
MLTGRFTHENGQYGLAHGVHHFRSFEEAETLPRVLERAGIAAGVIGKLHVAPESAYPMRLITADGIGMRQPEAYGRATRTFLETVKDKAFFLQVGFTDPHRAERAFGPRFGGPAHEKDAAKLSLPAYVPDTPEARGDWAAYLNAVERLDASVSEVMRAIGEMGREGDTLVVFFSDNGPPFAGAKTTVYDAGVRLPLIIARPGEASGEGKVCGALASWIDLAPTALEWLGQPGIAGLAGRSLLPFCADPKSADNREYIYGSHQFHEVTMPYAMRMARSRRYKYILNLQSELEFPFASDLHGSPSWQGVLRRGSGLLGKREVEGYLHRPAEEFYDLEADPDELVNLAGRPEVAAEQARFQEELARWRKETKDPWLAPSFRARSRLEERR